MRYLKLYENYHIDLVRLNRHLVSCLSDKNGWKLQNNPTSGVYNWIKGDMYISTQLYFPNNESSFNRIFHLSISITFNGEDEQKIHKKIGKINTDILAQKFVDWYVNELIPELFYMTENRNKVIKFLKDLIKLKGEKAKFGYILNINDTIDDNLIKRLNMNGVFYEDGELTFESYPIKKLFALYEYLIKKYPSVIVGKEWGFFDLERNEK